MEGYLVFLRDWKKLLQSFFDIVGKLFYQYHIGCLPAQLIFEWVTCQAAKLQCFKT